MSHGITTRMLQLLGLPTLIYQSGVHTNLRGDNDIYIVNKILPKFLWSNGSNRNVQRLVCEIPIKLTCVETMLQNPKESKLLNLTFVRREKI